jgi:hypothetical protein
MGAIIACAVLTAVFASGMAEAGEAIRNPSNVYRILKAGAKSAVLLRTFEKGILIWNVGSRRAEMIRWDQVDGLSRVVAWDSETPACRMLSWFCTARVEP